MKRAGGVSGKLLTIKVGISNVILSRSSLPRRNGDVPTAGDAVASWLVRSTPDQALGVSCVLGQDRGHSASLHPRVKIATGEHTAGGNPAMD